MSNQPLISIIAVCYNHQKYVVETLDSIINQTYTNIQLIIMDDCSSDNSVKVIQEWIDLNKKECVFIAHKQNKGVCKTLNESLKHVKGKYFKLISCDDVLIENYLEVITNVFENRSENIGLVYSDMETIDENGLIINKSYLFDRLNLSKLPDSINFNTIYSKNIIAAPSVIYRTKILETVGTYTENFLFEDFDFNLRVLKKFKCVLIPKVLVKYRILESSLIRSNNYNFEKSMIEIYEKHNNHSELSAKIFKNKISRFALKRFLDGNEVNYWFKKSLKYNFNVKTLLLYIVYLMNLRLLFIKILRLK